MEKLKFKPLKSLIIAEQIFEEVKKEEVSTSIDGLVLSLSAEDYDLVGKSAEKPAELLPTNQLMIHRVGKDCEEVKDGDTVIFNGKATRVRFGDKLYLVVRESDLIALAE